MNSEQFTYWLQGFVELNGSEPTAEQWQSIKDHLNTVFVKVTPSITIFNQTAPVPDAGKTIRDCMAKFQQAQRFGAEPQITC